MLRSFAFLSTLAAIAIPLAPTAAPAAPATKPNIIIFVADDLGVHFTGCYGNTAVRTPHLDALAKESMKFTRAFAASPTCSPSRAVLWTGLYPQRNGTMGNHTTCKPDITSLPKLLKPLGYRVVAANKTDVRPPSVFDWEVLPATLKKKPESPRFYRAEGVDPAAVDAFLAEHLKERSQEPLCLLIGDNCPHVTWEKNRDFDPARLPLPPNMVDTPVTREALANYFQDIATMDAHLGDVLASVQRHGLSQDTLFIFTSDQGAEFPRNKWTCYDAGLRVPFIVRWPEKIAAGENGALVSLVDVTPTLVDIGGGTAPSELDGRSFKRVLLGETQKHRDFIFASHTGDGTMNEFPIRAVRDERFKLILNLNPEREWTTHFTKVKLEPPFENTHKDVWDTWMEKAETDEASAKLMQAIRFHPKDELYDTDNDPWELKNLIDDPKLKLALERLRAELHTQRTRMGE
jgi:N-sulfoglucosamine sulfohydrolase